MPHAAAQVGRERVQHVAVVRDCSRIVLDSGDELIGIFGSRSCHAGSMAISAASCLSAQRHGRIEDIES